MTRLVKSQLSKANEPCIDDLDCLADWELCDTSLHASVDHDAHFDLKEDLNGDLVIGNGVCEHKEVFPMFGSEFFACFLVIFLLAFTNTGGLGGGGIIVPTMMGLFRFDTRNAVSISNFSIATSTAVRYFMNLREPHPLKSGNGTLNDYGVTLLMLPSIVIGASLGAIVNLSLPGPIICAGFICCNMVTAGIGLRNFFKVRKAENAKKIIQAPVVEMEDRASVAENEDNQDKAVAEDSEENKE